MEVLIKQISVLSVMSAHLNDRNLSLQVRFQSCYSCIIIQNMLILNDVLYKNVYISFDF